MSIKRLNAICDLSHELRLLNEDIRKYEREVQRNLEYIQTLKETYTNPHNTINKFINKSIKLNHMIEKLKKDRWFLRKELVMLEQGHEYE